MPVVCKIGHIKQAGDGLKAEGSSGHKDHLYGEGDVHERESEVQQLRDQLARLKRQIIQSSAAAEDEKADIRRVCAFPAMRQTQQVVLMPFERDVRRRAPGVRRSGIGKRTSGGIQKTSCCLAFQHLHTAGQVAGALHVLQDLSCVALPHDHLLLATAFWWPG